MLTSWKGQRHQRVCGGRSCSCHCCVQANIVKREAGNWDCIKTGGLSAAKLYCSILHTFYLASRSIGCPLCKPNWSSRCPRPWMQGAHLQ